MSKATNDPWAPQSSIPRIAMPGGLDPMKLNMSSEEYIATLGENITIKTFNYWSDIELILPFSGGGRKGPVGGAIFVASYLLVYG